MLFLSGVVVIIHPPYIHFVLFKKLYCHMSSGLLQFGWFANTHFFYDLSVYMKNLYFFKFIKNKSNTMMRIAQVDTKTK